MHTQRQIALLIKARDPLEYLESAFTFYIRRQTQAALEEGLIPVHTTFRMTRNQLRSLQGGEAIEKSKGEAEAIRIINEELEKSPQYIEFLATQKWDGKLPLVTGDATPFIQIPTK